MGLVDPGAIELRRQDGTLVDARVSISLVGGKTVAVLTFVGSGFTGGSLADGRYTLTVRADLVHDRFGRELDGDGDVDQQDRDHFRSAFGTTAPDAGYLWYFDFDGDGDVDGRDNGQFNRRFGQD